MRRQTGTVVVTGMHGFLGRHVSLAAARHGMRVVGIGHGTWAPGESEAWGFANSVSCDVTSDALLQLGEKPDVIVHCAGSGSAALARTSPREDFAKSIKTTVEVLDYVRAESPDTMLVFPSSGAVYGQPTQLPARADAALDPISPYGVHKRIAEELVQSYGRHFGVKASIVRIFSLYGVGLRKQLWWDACQKVTHGVFDFWGTGSETRDWVSVEDAAALLLLAASHAASDVPVANCASGVETTIHDTLSVLFAALGAHQKPLFSGTRSRGDVQRYVGDPSVALEWGWEPKWTWPDGVADYAHWFFSLEAEAT